MATPLVASTQRYLGLPAGIIAPLETLMSNHSVTVWTAAVYHRLRYSQALPYLYTACIVPYHRRRSHDTTVAHKAKNSAKLYVIVQRMILTNDEILPSISWK